MYSNLITREVNNLNNNFDNLKLQIDSKKDDIEKNKNIIDTKNATIKSLIQNKLNDIEDFIRLYNKNNSIDYNLYKSNLQNKVFIDTEIENITNNFKEIEKIQLIKEYLTNFNLNLLEEEKNTIIEKINNDILLLISLNNSLIGNDVNIINNINNLLNDKNNNINLLKNESKKYKLDEIENTISNTQVEDSVNTYLNTLNYKTVFENLKNITDNFNLNIIEFNTFFSRPIYNIILNYENQTTNYYNNKINNISKINQFVEEVKTYFNSIKIKNANTNYLYNNFISKKYLFKLFK